MVDEGNYGAAATLLHSLLWSKLAPKYFWVTLLMDAIPFLTADELLFTSEQTYELLQCLQVGCILEFFFCPNRQAGIFCRRFGNFFISA
jgi:hypothetical protein